MNDTIITWQDLAGQLTSDQVARFVHRERLYGHEPGYAGLLARQAREHIERNRIDAERFGHIEAPADAQGLGHWQVDTIEGDWVREFEAGSHTVDEFVANVIGEQRPDATVLRRIAVHCPEGQPFTAEQARRIAAALLAAAEDIDPQPDDGGDVELLRSALIGLIGAVAQREGVTDLDAI